MLSPTSLFSAHQPDGLSEEKGKEGMGRPDGGPSLRDTNQTGVQGPPSQRQESGTIDQGHGF